MRPYYWLLVSILFGACSNHAPPGAAEEKPVRETRAVEILKQMGDYLKGANEFTFRTEISYDEVLKTGQKFQFSRRAEVAVKRPNRLHADVDGDQMNEGKWYDGKRFTVLDRSRNVYSTAAVPGDIDSAIDFMAEQYGEVSPLADLVYSDPYAILIEHVKSALYLGLHRVRGIRCHHLAFSQDNIDWQIWIEDGHQPVPRKFVITYKQVKTHPQLTGEIYDWNFAPHLSDSLFKFLAPPDATRTEFSSVSQ